MSDIGAIVLHKLLKEKSLEGWSRVKLAFLDPSYSGLYTAINKYYNKYNCIPSFEELELASRNTPLLRAVSTLKELEIPEELELDFAIDILVDTYTQNESLRLVDKFVDNVTLMSTQEIKDNLSEIVVKLDEKTHTSETIVTLDSIALFEEEEVRNLQRFPLGLNNTFDSTLGGGYREELILIGGRRGAGKSIVCSNLVVNQYEQKKTAVYFTIEMKAKEIIERAVATLSGVAHTKLRQNDLSFEDKIKVAKVRADMFLDAEIDFKEFLEHKDIIKFEKGLIANKSLKPDNQMVVIDDRELSIISIDLHLQKLKAQFGDNLTLVAVDYLNQIVVPGLENNMYEWNSQIFVSKKLKEYARKYNILIVSPYQIKDDGETRFSKGILDAADIAINLDAHSKEDCAMSFNMTKIRGGPPVNFTSGMNWDTLRINPTDVVLQAKKENSKKGAKEAPGDRLANEDLPWNN
jgi:replicative DNA helicase